MEKLTYEPVKPPRPIDFQRLNIRRKIELFAPLLALILLVLFTTWRNPAFIKPENVLNILRNQSFIGILAIGMTFVILSGGIDLSVGSLLAFSGGLGIWLMNTATGAAKIISENEAARQATLDLPWSGPRESLARLFTSSGMAGSDTWGLWIAIAAILLTATLAGALSGLAIAKVRFPPFIATLVGLAVYRSFAKALVEASEFRALATSDSTFAPPSIILPKVGQGGIGLFGAELAPGIPLTLPYPVIALLLITLISWFILGYTTFGRSVYAIGGNERAARYSGINVVRVKTLIYTLMGLYTGIAAYLLASRFNAISSTNTGLFYELDAIAAVVIGGTRIEGGKGGVWGTLVGVLILGVISNMLNLIPGISIYLQGAVTGGIMAGVVLIQLIGGAKSDE